MLPQDFLNLAEWLLVNKKDPSGFRSSASRAYYAAFQTALSMLAEMGIFIPRNDDKHKKVPDLLEHTGDQVITKLGEKLKNLREERNKADYDLKNVNAESEPFAELRLHEAKDVVASLNTCLTSKGMPGGRFETAKAAAKQRANIIFLGIDSAS